MIKTVLKIFQNLKELQGLHLKYNSTDIIGITFPQLMDEETLTAHQNPSRIKELEHLKQQRTKMQRVFVINRTISCVGVDANIVIVFALCVNGTVVPSLQINRKYCAVFLCVYL